MESVPDPKCSMARIVSESVVITNRQREHVILELSRA